MKLLLQRVSQASVSVDDQVVGQIQQGFLAFIGFEKGDTHNSMDVLIKKMIELRVFEDDQGKMNRSVEDIEGGLLLVSQFTLAGNCDKGRRPSFDTAMPPDEARAFYDRFIQVTRERTVCPVETGIFGAHMMISLINDGPVTFMLEHTS